LYLENHTPFASFAENVLYKLDVNATGEMQEVIRLMKTECRLLFSAVLTSGLIVMMAGYSSLNLQQFVLGSNPLRVLPEVVVWAWERPENLSFIDPNKVAVAVLAKTVYIKGTGIYVRPRMQPIVLPRQTRVVAVVRIEASRSHAPMLSDAQREEIRKEIISLADSPAVVAIQIDFDATASQRQFYRTLLSEIRNELPDNIGLSITALASWCLFDTWIRGLPIDEAVPMVFRMGRDESYVRQWLSEGHKFSLSLCRKSIGIATDEPIVGIQPHRRVYVFNARPWSESVLRHILREVER